MGLVKDIMEVLKKAESTLPHILAIQEGALGSALHLKWMLDFTVREMKGRVDPSLVKTIVDAEYQI